LLFLLGALAVPNLVRGQSDETTIGTSQRGRPITVTRVGSGSTPVLILGGQHGGPERNTVQLAEYLLSYFQAAPDEIPSNVRLDFITVANPDGLASGSRQFASGVDPNRNWGGPDWGPDASDSNGIFKVGLGGPEPFSEPETQALRDYVLSTRPVFTINYHSRGGFILGGRSGLGDQLAQSYSDASGYRRGGAAGGGTGSLLSYRATGSMNVWMASENLHAILIELATADQPETARNLAGVRAVLQLLRQQPASESDIIAQDAGPKLSCSGLLRPLAYAL
jgi:hypothetical protein